MQTKCGIFITSHPGTPLQLDSAQELHMFCGILVWTIITHMIDHQHNDVLV